jgi:hypothetical protein
MNFVVSFKVNNIYSIFYMNEDECLINNQILGGTNGEHSIY